MIARNVPAELKSTCQVILPAAAWGEYRGTFTNFRGRTQRLDAAFEPLGESVPVWKIVSDLSALLKKPLGWESHSEVLHALSQSVVFYASVTWETLGEEGLTLGRVGEAVKAG
jgi:formate dehydrogenase major subunit